MRSLTLPLALATCACALSQISDTEPTPIIGMRMPAVSPDGTRIAFQYRGDIWVVPSTGGMATRITSHLELETRPIWSPDGKWIAFTSDRNGNNDIFAIPAAGGDSRQITYSGGNETATGWSPDGKYIAFTGQRDSPFTGIFAIDVRSLRFRLIAQDYQGFSNPQFSPDGKTIVASRSGFPWTRPRYSGSGAAQIVSVDTDTGSVKRIVDNERQNLWPSFAPDGKSILCVTYGDVTPSSRKLGAPAEKFVDSADRTPNIWRFDLSGRGTRVTSSVGEPIRHFSVSQDGSMVYESGGHVYMLRGGRSAKLDIVLYGDAKENSITRQVLTNGAASAAVVSPDRKSFLLTAGAELWSVPIEKPKGRNKDDAERLTDYPGVDESPVWSSDGRSAYFISDRDGARRLYVIELSTKVVKSITEADADVIGPELSPDGSKLAYWLAGGQGGLYIWPTSGGAPRRVVEQSGSHFFGTSAGEFEWSPDSQWIAFTRLLEARTTNVWVVPSAGGEAKQVTRRNVAHSALAWSADGKYLYFRSARDGGGYYILPLQKDIEDPQEAELKYEKQVSVSVKIDFADIEDRSRRFFAQAVDANPVSDKETGKLYFLSQGGMFVSDYDGKTQRRIAEGVQSFVLSDDGKHAYGLRSGTPFSMALSGSNPVTDVSFRAELIQNSDLVRRAAFNEFWRMYNRGFYDGNFHGRDWTRIGERYLPLVAGVGHRKEFSELLNMMVGELEGSHTEVSSAAGGNTGGPSVSHPGFVFDYSYAGPGIRIKSLLDRTPGTFEKTKLNPGDYVIAINGIDVTLDEKLWEVLHNQSGRDLVLLVNATPSKIGAREVRYRALSPGEFSSQRYRNWVTDNRKSVERESEGKIGYVHIQGMGGGNRTIFEEEFHEYKIGKEAMIIDVRFNGGGNISDSLIDVLERKSHGFYQYRDASSEPAPSTDIWDKPIVVLHNEGSFSNAEMFPYAMKARGLALLVGMPTPGYVIWTWGGRLVDGTGIRMPMGGVYRLDGSPMENLGQQPDIRIPWPNEEFLSGKDPQLERAIAELLKKVPK